MATNSKEYRKKYYENNKRVINEQQKIWYQKHKTKVIKNSRIYAMKKLYGLTPDDYNQMLEEQNFSCALCTRHASEFKRALFVDHDHTTGVVRGLLCAKCNLGLGNLGDSIEGLERAVDYLKKETIDAD